jgi:hypothetical protein
MEGAFRFINSEGCKTRGILGLYGSDEIILSGACSGNGQEKAAIYLFFIFGRVCVRVQPGQKPSREI